MPQPTLHTSTLQFLKDLSLHNNRDWFNARKHLYLEAQANVEEFVDALIVKMNAHDHIITPSGKKSLYRIYHDVRFSKDKSPYTARFSGYLKRAKPLLRGGYYFWIKPGSSHVGCGFSYPHPDDLKRIRQDISDNYEDWNKLLKTKSIRSTFGEMQGEKVKTAPQGFRKDHPAIDLLRYKQFWFEHSFTDKEVLDRDFLNKMNKTFMMIRPFFDYMSEVLTTDLNGVEITN
jgi:uncharacterized protein (TIGR02453 family)